MKRFLIIFLGILSLFSTEREVFAQVINASTGIGVLSDRKNIYADFCNGAFESDLKFKLVGDCMYGDFRLQVFNPFYFRLNCFYSELTGTGIDRDSDRDVLSGISEFSVNGHTYSITPCFSITNNGVRFVIGYKLTGYAMKFTDGITYLRDFDPVTEEIDGLRSTYSEVFNGFCVVVGKTFENFSIEFELSNRVRYSAGGDWNLRNLYFKNTGSIHQIRVQIAAKLCTLYGIDMYFFSNYETLFDFRSNKYGEFTINGAAVENRMRIFEYDETALRLGLALSLSYGDDEHE